jgi:hypothetical protein
MEQPTPHAKLQDAIGALANHVRHTGDDELQVIVGDVRAYAAELGQEQEALRDALQAAALFVPELLGDDARAQARRWLQRAAELSGPQRFDDETRDLEDDG